MTAAAAHRDGEVQRVGREKPARRRHGGERDYCKRVGHLQYRRAAGDTGSGGACRRVLPLTDGSANSQRAMEYFGQFPFPAGLDVWVMRVLRSRCQIAFPVSSRLTCQSFSATA
jgi:hypothetical protein